jgi:hypothetical protein
MRFASLAAKSGKVYRVSLSLPLGGRTMSNILAEWTKRFGPPYATRYADGKRAAQVGWGFRPGPQGSPVKVGANHLVRGASRRQHRDRVARCEPSASVTSACTPSSTWS